MFHSPKYWKELKAKRKADEKKLEKVSTAEQEAEAKQEQAEADKLANDKFYQWKMKYSKI
tara:strand:- start:6926 stop:7105 length:180 start_codon:yes stop_codon:yes gene_type:complete